MWRCVWLCGCVVVWLCGCVVVWLCGCVVVWLCGCVAVWVIHLLISGHDRAQIWHVCADRYSHLKKIKNLTHPTPGGFRGLYIV